MFIRINDLAFERKIINEQDSFCKKHNKSFTAVTHKLPSGKLYITSCDSCEYEKLEANRYNEMIKHFKKNGHTIIDDKWSWEIKKEVEIVEERKPTLSRFFRK